MEKLPHLPKKMGEIESSNLYLSGIHMDIPQDERLKNDLTKSGVFCKKDGHEMEKVSAHLRYTCHWCGGIVEHDKEGKEVEWFEGF